MIGLDGTNFLMNSGTLFLIFSSWFFMVPLYFLVKLITIVFNLSKITIVLEFVSNWLFFNFIIRVLLESYIDLTLTALLNLKNTNW